MDLLRCHTYLHSSFKCILQFCIKLKIGTYLLKCKWSRGEFKKLKDVCHEYHRFHWWRHQIKTSQISRNMWKRGRFLLSLFHYFTRPWQSPCIVMWTMWRWHSISEADKSCFSIYFTSLRYHFSHSNYW